MRARRMRGASFARRCLLSMVATWLLVGSPVGAQSEPVGPLKLQGQLDLSSPGARSLGMAGAFLARADDATAAYVNPAGLIHLRFTEIAVEGRRWEQDVEVFDPNGARSDLESSHSGLSFAGVSYPLGRVTLGLYLNELAGLDVSTRGAGFQSADLDLSVNSVGLAAGFEILSWFRVGVALVGYQSDVGGASVGLGGLTTTVESDETDFGYILGYQADLAKNWSLGFVYRDAADFDLAIETVGEPQRNARFGLPSILGLGLGWQATHRLAASLDYNVVNWSSTVSGKRIEDGPFEGGPFEGGKFVASDAREIRLGFEYTIWEYETSPAFRVGVWEEPEHRVRWRPADGSPVSGPADEFPAGDDEIHWSVGAGLVLGRFQLDLAADLADSSDTYSLSIVVFP